MANRRAALGEGVRPALRPPPPAPPRRRLATVQNCGRQVAGDSTAPTQMVVTTRLAGGVVSLEPVEARKRLRSRAVGRSLTLKQRLVGPAPAGGYGRPGRGRGR